MFWTPESQAMPARPSQSSVLAITTSGSHWVGTQWAVAKVLTEPGSRSDQPLRNSCPNRRWKYVSKFASGTARALTSAASVPTRISVGSARSRRKLSRSGSGVTSATTSCSSGLTDCVTALILLGDRVPLDAEGPGVDSHVVPGRVVDGGGQLHRVDLALPQVCLRDERRALLVGRELHLRRQPGGAT